MSSTLNYTEKVTSDATSEVTLFSISGGSIFSKTEVISGSARGIKSTLKRGLEKLRQGRTRDLAHKLHTSKSDPNKSWEARYMSAR